MKVLSPFYQRFLTEPITTSFDTRLECGSCKMAEPQWSGSFAQEADGRTAQPLSRDPGPFQANLKCCTFAPFLPNFTVGALLESNPQFRDRLLASTKTSVLHPLGLIPPERDVSSSKIDRGFGRDEARACSFLVDGQCSIWRHRSAVCASYVCISDGGAKGFAFWDAVKEFGSRLEWTLAHEVLWQMGWTQDDIEAGSFAEFANRREEFYLRCYNESLKIEPQSWREFASEGMNL